MRVFPSRSRISRFDLFEALESRVLLSGPGGGGGGGDAPTPPITATTTSGGPATAPLLPAAQSVPGPFGGGGRGGGGSGGGGGGGGGGGATTGTSNLFLGRIWGAQVGSAFVRITFNANGSFSMTDTESDGTQVVLQGNYTLSPSPNPSVAGVPQTLLTMTSQGKVVLFGLATFRSPESVVFGVGTQNIPGSGLPSDMPAQIFLIAGA